MDRMSFYLLFVVVGIIAICDTTHGQATARHVVHIGVDGLIPSCMNNAPGGNLNMMNRLAAQGTYTLTNARASIEAGCAVGWTNTLCGMDSTATGVLNNGWTPPWHGNTQPITPVTGNDKAFPCVFKTIKEQNSNVKTASWYSWNWLRHLHNEAVNGSVDEEYYCPDSYKVCDERIANMSSNYLRQTLPSAEGSYSFIYFGQVDDIGHSSGMCSADYLRDVAATDTQIGQVLDAIEQVNMQDQTLVLLSSEHGGAGSSHGSQNDANLHVPMFMRGPGIKINNQFQYFVSIKDMAPTALYALGMQPSPWWQGEVMSEAFSFKK